MVKVPEPTKQDLEHMREWLQKMQHIPQDFDDARLKDFIKGSKGSLQRAKIVLERYCSLGQRYPGLASDLDPLSKSAQDHFLVSKYYPLPKKTLDDSLVIINQVVEGQDPYMYSLDQAYKNLIRVHKVYSLENNYGSGSFILVIDGRNMQLAHLREMTPTVMKAWWEATQTSMPVRLAGVHGVFVPQAFEWFFKLAKSVVTSKLADRIHVHSSLESFYKFVPREMMPADFGGDEQSSDVLNRNWRKKEESYRKDIMEEEIKIRALDYARPKKQDQEIIGTFKKLTFD